MTETTTESFTAESTVILPETSPTPILPSSSSSPSNTVDDETKRRKILSKLWGKGNKLSHKVRELEKSTTSISSDSSIHNDNDQQRLSDNPNNHSSYSSMKDSKLSTEDSSNSINSSKPLAVVKPIVVVKSGLIVAPAVDRTRVNSEASSTTNAQIDENTATTTTVIERQPPSTTTTDRTSSKKKKSHKHADSKKKKTTTRDKSNERDRSKDRHHHQKDENTSKKNSSSSSKSHRREHNEEISVNDNHHTSSRPHSSSTTSLTNNKRRSPSNDADHSNRRSSRPTTSRGDEPSSSKRSPLSPIDPHRYRRAPSRARSPSPLRSRHSNTNGDRIQTKNSSSPKKDNRGSVTTSTSKSNRQQTESVSNSKSTNSISPSHSYSNHRHHGTDTVADHDTPRRQARTSNENLISSSKSQRSHEVSSAHRSSSSSARQEKSKTIINNDENNSDRRKLSSSRPDRRSHSRHRSKSKEDKPNRKTIESSNSDESSINKTKINHEKDSTAVHENSNNDKKSSRGSSIPSTNDKHRRKSSSDYHRYDRHHSPSNYDRKNDYYYHHHRHSHHPSTHYVHHHHHHHYRSRSSSRYNYHRRSVSPRSHQHRSRYFSSSSSSLSPSPRRRSLSRTSSSRSSSSYSSISRTSSSRSSSRNNHYYPHHHRHHEKKFRRSPTLEKLFLKASESIESVSTQKNPNISSSTRLISNPTSDIQISSPRHSHSETNAFYAESFSGFSAPPPPFISQPPQQRCLKEITTDSSTSRRLMFNEVPSSHQSSTSSVIDEVIPIKPIQSSDLSTNVRSGSIKPPRVSRFSDITPSVKSEPALNTNLPVDTLLNYSQINENINCLPTSRRQQKRHNREVMECECTTSEYDRSRGIKACGYECLNRMLLIECSSICPCGQWCTNRRFQRRSYASHKIALFKTEMKGYGLRTIGSLRKGRFLVEYIGEVIDMDELARRNKKYKRDGNIHQYVMSLIHGTVIDSTIKGNWARFINHSCEPNCVAEKWLVNGEYRMGIFAKRDLDINEEMTIDYRFETFGAVDLANEKCYCGAPTCRGTISIKSNNNNLNKRQNRRQPLDDDELLDYLRDDETNEYIIPKTIEEIRQLIQIMSRTDSENVRTIELDLIRNSSQKHFELPRLFLECNGLHVLCSWMKDILINDNDNEQQQYSDEFKYHLLDFIQTVLPIKDRTTVIKNGLLDLVYKKLKLPLITTTTTDNNDQEKIQDLMNSILNHLDDPVIDKLFHLYQTWMSLKERYIIPKRKESQETSNHHHHHRHHHHHSSKHPSEENNYRLSFSTRSAIIQPKPFDRSNGRRSFIVRDIPRTQEQQLSKDERRKLFEQQYEDAEKARAAAAVAIANGDSPGGQNEPPHKKLRTSDSAEPVISNASPQSQALSMSNSNYWTLPPNASSSNQTEQIYWIHQHLSQIPIEYIRSYMTSIGQPISVLSASTGKDELPPLPPPPRPDDENELSRIIRLPSDWSVAMCPSDSSVYFYNRQTMATSWTPPSFGTPTDNAGAPSSLIDLSPLSSAQITEQHRPHHQQLSSSSRATSKLSKHPHRHSRSHRYNHHHHTNSNSNTKRKRPSEVESTSAIEEEPQLRSTDETSMIVSNEQIKDEEINDKESAEHMEEMYVSAAKVSMDENNETDVLTTVKESSELNDDVEEPTSSNNHTLSSSSKLNRDLLRKNISQHVHTTLKPYTKRTCKQGRIVSTDDIKYLVKKFTLAVLDKEIEKAKNDGIPLLPILTDRVRLKTEVYVKKYMNKMGSVFQRHETTAHHPSQPAEPTATTTTSNSE